MEIASSPELSAVFSKIHFHGLVRDQADDLEKIQLSYALVACIAQVQLAYEQAKEGLITQDELDESTGPARLLLETPYLASTWSTLSHGYSTEFTVWFRARFGLDSRVSPDQLQAGGGDSAPE